MSDSYISLGWLDLALAAGLIAVNGALSVALQLKIERALVIAAARSVVQLLLLGLALQWLFSHVSLWVTVAAALFMVLFAGQEVVARQERRLSGVWSYGLGAGSMLLAAGVVTGFALITQVRPDPWYHPRYALPLLGMVLGNTLTGVSLGLDTLLRSVVRERLSIEARLALGHDRVSALLPVARTALKTALMPIVNSMAAAGVVSIPGMMTGQLLAGTPPLEAAKYQVLILFLIAGGTGLGAFAAVLGGVFRATDARDRLRLDHLSR